MNALVEDAWRTGRAYTTNGQRVAALVLEDGRVMFNDVDRGIVGLTRNTFDASDPLGWSLRDFTMHEYDHCRYGSPYTLPNAVELMQRLELEARAL